MRACELRILQAVPKRDVSQEAVRNVDRITDSEPVDGEELLRSEKLKRQLREVRERLKSESTDKPRE